MSDLTRDEILAKLSNKEAIGELNLEKIDLSGCDLADVQGLHMMNRHSVT